MRSASPDSTSVILFAKGRALITRSCARLSLAAETIFMALVICCVFLTDLIRRRMSRRLGIEGTLRSCYSLYHRLPACVCFASQADSLQVLSISLEQFSMW